MVLSAEMALRGALMRKETRENIFYRDDYPVPDNENWLKWIELKKEDGAMRFSTSPVPIDSYPLKVDKDRQLHYAWKLAEKLKVVSISQGEVKWV